MFSSRIVISSTAALLLLTLVACKEGQEDTNASKSESVNVSVIALHSQSVQLTEQLPGRVVASLEAEVRPQVAGIIQKRLFTEGGEVKAGEILYKIDSASYQAAYESAAADLLKVQAAIPSAQAVVDRDKILVKQNAISQQDYETALAALGQANASVAAAKAAVQTARINLDYTTVRAPISGRIDKSSLTPGALVAASQTTALTTIRQVDPINVDLTQSSVSLLNLRQAIAAGRVKASGTDVNVQLKLENGTVYPLVGKLAFIESSVSTTTGSYTLRATFPNPDRMLVPGMYVRAVIDEGAAAKVFLLPQRVVSRNARGEATALFVNSGKVEQRVLAVTRSVGNAWMVESGVLEGDQVIVEGSQGVTEGDVVAPVLVAIDEQTGEIRKAEPNVENINISRTAERGSHSAIQPSVPSIADQHDSKSRGQ